MNSDKELFRKYLAQTSGSPIGLEIEKAEGVYLYAPDGKKYIDLISGISVSSLGHGNPEVKKAVHDQIERHMHLMVYGEYIQSAQVRLAERLIELLPGQFEKVYFTNSGSEAVEGALKLAKRVTARTEIISFKNAYHGHTQGALSIMGDEAWKRNFRPLLPDVKMLTFNSFEDIQHISESTACVIIEPVQGEAGVILPAEAYLPAIRERCNETGALLIFDEVQTGMGRTGELLACMKYGVIPDILLLAKALGSGMPLGAFISSGKIMDELTHHPVLGHITTFGGHPVSCAAALAGLNYLVERRIIHTVEEKASLFYKLLHDKKGVREIRYSGLLMAVELEDEAKVQELIQYCLQRGVISDWFLFRPSALRIAPPLIISEDEIISACQVIAAGLEAL
ncbi:MAG: aspartate aminotransferase family protein [Bacteroidales bacterium]